VVGAVADGDCIFALTEAGAADFAPTWTRAHDSRRLSFRINPAQRGVERNSPPYQIRRYTAPQGSRWSIALSIQSASASKPQWARDSRSNRSLN